jgi:glycosyltransferase involved in cell wall biosynthesis
MVSPEKYKIKRNYSNEPNRLLFCGEIKRSKGIFLLLSIMPNLIIDYPQLKLLVMGSGSGNKELIRKAILRNNFGI